MKAVRAMIDLHRYVNGKLVPKRVAAMSVGPLAYHPTVGERGRWTVTHRATGKAIYRVLVCAKDAKTVTTILSTLEWPDEEAQIISNKRLKSAVAKALKTVGIAIFYRVQP